MDNIAPKDSYRWQLGTKRFSLEVLRLVWAWFSLPGRPDLASCSQGTTKCLSAIAAKTGTAMARNATTILLYCWWNIWKEQSRSIFESLHRNELQVASWTKYEIELYKLVFREDWTLVSLLLSPIRTWWSELVGWSKCDWMEGLLPTFLVLDFLQATLRCLLFLCSFLGLGLWRSGGSRTGL
jgi:hypothetical protein